MISKPDFARRPRGADHKARWRGRRGGARAARKKWPWALQKTIDREPPELGIMRLNVRDFRWFVRDHLWRHGRRILTDGMPEDVAREMVAREMDEAVLHDIGTVAGWE